MLHLQGNQSSMGAGSSGPSSGSSKITGGARGVGIVAFGTSPVVMSSFSLLYSSMSSHTGRVVPSLFCSGFA